MTTEPRSTKEPRLTTQPGVTDADRLRGLRRMQAVALGLLVLAALVYALTHGSTGVLGYVNAAAEASMVGAVADWFAVTALFRRPLGLPIPHTALIPERKQALGASLQQFVAENFLTPDVARERVAAAQPAVRVGRWLRDPAHARRVVRDAAPALRRALQQVEEEQLRTFVEQVLLPRLAGQPLSPVAGHLLQAVVRDGTHRGLVDLALTEGHRWLLSHQHSVAGALRTRAPWWSPAWLDDRVVGRVHGELLAWVADVRDDELHPARASLDSLLRQLAEDLQHDETTRARAELFKERVLAHPGVADGVVSVGGSVKAVLLDSLAELDGPLQASATRALVDLGERLVRDEELQAVVDARAGDAVAYLVQAHGSELAAVISHTVDRWDGVETARRVELLVGRDLQFIRINGTVVGGLVGLLIHAVSEIL